jgi:GxxExxY protein
LLFALSTKRKKKVNLSVLCVSAVKYYESLQPIHEAQLLTYLRLTGIKIGLLINFNVPVLKEGIRRLAN